MGFLWYDSFILFCLQFLFFSELYSKLIAFCFLLMALNFWKEDFVCQFGEPNWPRVSPLKGQELLVQLVIRARACYLLSIVDHQAIGPCLFLQMHSFCVFSLPNMPGALEKVCQLVAIHRQVGDDTLVCLKNNASKVVCG